MPHRQHRRRYTIAYKREAIELAEIFSEEIVSARLGISRRTLRGWIANAGAIMAHQGSARRLSVGGQGRHEKIPFSQDLVTHMKDVRRAERVLSTRGLIEYIRATQAVWFALYVASKPSHEHAFNSLMRLIQRFVNRHGFSGRVPAFTKKPSEDLLFAQIRFSLSFWPMYSLYDPSCILNVDETAIYFDTPPGRVWAEKGGSSRIRYTQKHSMRMTAVLTIRADGTKLPILFIISGQPGGTIEMNELPFYPDGHWYTAQENAWMDETFWRHYVLNCLRYEIKSPSVLLLDNFDAHVSAEGERLVAEETCCAVAPLPANATSVCQPLDVGVMGPFKAKMRSLWLEELTTPKSMADKRNRLIQRAIKAWEQIDAATIASSFNKAIPKTFDVDV